MALLTEQTNEDTGDDWIGEIDRPYARYLLWTAILAFGSVALAVGLQHYSDMHPCAWCVLQRLIYLLLGACALVAWLMGGSPGAARGVASIALALGVSGLVAALWQHFVATADLSCNLTFADKVVSGLGLDQTMPWLFQASAMCNEANIPLIGVPFAMWSAGLFSVLVVMLSITVFSKGPLR